MPYYYKSRRKYIVAAQVADAYDALRNDIKKLPYNMRNVKISILQDNKKFFHVSVNNVTDVVSGDSWLAYEYDDYGTPQKWFTISNEQFNLNFIYNAPPQ